MFYNQVAILEKMMDNDVENILPYLPDIVADALIADDKKGFHTSKMWYNQVAMFDRLHGKDINVLPYLPDQNAHDVIENRAHGFREYMMWFNQLSIFDKILML